MLCYIHEPHLLLPEVKNVEATWSICHQHRIHLIPQDLPPRSWKCHNLHQWLGSTCTSCLLWDEGDSMGKRMVQCTYMWLWGYWELYKCIAVLTIGTGIGIVITIWQSRATTCQPAADTHIMRVRRMHTRAPLLHHTLSRMDSCTWKVKHCHPWGSEV